MLLRTGEGGEGPKEEDNKNSMICRYIDEGIVGM
jgi:hypothetical protein